MATLGVRSETWPIRGQFAISRGSKNKVEVVIAEISDGSYKGRGECVPYPRYGESIDSVITLIQAQQGNLERGMSRSELQTELPAGAARNALDCALWDLQAKKENKSPSALLGMTSLKRLTTAYTLSLNNPEKMELAARENAHRPLLKLKLAGEGDFERVQAVREGARDSRLIVDANEGWTPELYEKLVPQLLSLGVEMIEQPFPAGEDDSLKSLPHPITICADESCHDRNSLTNIIGKYDMINIKLDKTGGLTEALALRDAAEAKGLKIMVGCMLATSLSMAPAMLVAQNADIVDLDGPLLLAKDRDGGLQFEQSYVYPPQSRLWG